MGPTRRDAMLALLGAGLAGCGGGGGGSPPAGPAGTVRTLGLHATSNGNDYPLYVYVPAADAAAPGPLPVVYLLDGESRFQTLVDIVDGHKLRVIVVGIGNEANRNNDYVPPNLCTLGGGGQGAYLDFIRTELTPFVEANFAADSQHRFLLGHSHGGSFVLYALFSQPADGHHFSAYLASDASIGCMSGNVYGWEAAYAAANSALPVRLHLAYAANLANADFALQVQSRNYDGLTMVSQFYAGGHIGMIPEAFLGAVSFALAG